VVAIPAAGTVDDEALISAVVRSTLWLMAADRKVTALKALQGRVWETGFASGALRGEFYGDVQPCLESWHRRGYKVRTRGGRAKERRGSDILLDLRGFRDSPRPAL
jgi:methionine salvage enolase-phosphatase E1